MPAPRYFHRVRFVNQHTPGNRIRDIRWHVSPLYTRSHEHRNLPVPDSTNRQLSREILTTPPACSAAISIPPSKSTSTSGSAPRSAPLASVALQYLTRYGSNGICSFTSTTGIPSWLGINRSNSQGIRSSGIDMKRHSQCQLQTKQSLHIRRIHTKNIRRSNVHYPWFVKRCWFRQYFCRISSPHCGHPRTASTNPPNSRTKL